MKNSCISAFCIPALLTVSIILSGCAEYRKKKTEPFRGFAIEGLPANPEHVLGSIPESGFIPQLILFFMMWPSPDELTISPLSSLEAVDGCNATPVVTWEPMFIKESSEITITAESITSGSFDSYIDFFAQECKRFKKPLLIRFAHEMNLSRYHWGTDEKDFGKHAPASYRKMFKYIVNRFRKLDCCNVLWAFCPNAESVPPATGSNSWNSISAYYPGNDYVDILGLDGYNWGLTRNLKEHGWKSSWRSFEQIFSPAMKEIFSLHAKKPLIIFETASVSSGGNKAEWIRTMLSFCRNSGINAWIWFQAEKETNWRIDETADYCDIEFNPVDSDIEKWLTGLLHDKD